MIKKLGLYLMKNFWFLVLLLLALYIIGFNLNKVIFLFINKYHFLLPTFIWEFINLISYAKYSLFILLLLILTYIYQVKFLKPVILLCISYYVIFYLLKILIKEPRPYVTLDLQSFYWINMYEDTLKNAYRSFPSGHVGQVAIFGFAVINLFAKQKIWLQILMIMLILLVSIARICTGWHWPIDVIGSILISYLLTTVILKAYIKKSK